MRISPSSVGALVLLPCLSGTAIADCTGDIFEDGVVNGADLAALLSYWGPTTSSVASQRCDLNGNGMVDGTDLSMLLSNWGVCPVTGLPEWATLIEMQPDPSVVTDPAIRAAIAASGRPWRVRDTASGIELVLIPAGSFQMGCTASSSWPCASDESPSHQVVLTEPFYLGRYEVTQAQWRARMGSNPAYFSNTNGQPGADDRPVEQISWNAIQGFLAGTGMRLPSEAEWEYAYRAGTTTAYHGWPANPGGTNNDGQVGEIAWYLYNTCYGTGCGTRPVGLKAPNGFGVNDMSGNVGEWVNDRYGAYPTGSQVNPTGAATGTQRILRGGCWFNSNPSFNVRSSSRFAASPDLVTRYDGFRVARNP